MKIEKLVETMPACPQRYEGMTKCGLEISIKTRGGWAILYVGDKEYETVFENDPYKGYLEENELEELLTKANLSW